MIPKKKKKPTPSVQFSSIAQLGPTPMDWSTPGLPVHRQLPEFTQTHVHWVSDAIQPSHPLLSASPLTFNFSQWESQFLGRLIRSLGSPRREGSGILKEEGRTNFFFFVPLYSLGLHNNDAACLRTVSRKNLANLVILKCKIWE